MPLNESKPDTRCYLMMKSVAVYVSLLTSCHEQSRPKLWDHPPIWIVVVSSSLKSGKRKISQQECRILASDSTEHSSSMHGFRKHAFGSKRAQGHKRLRLYEIKTFCFAIFLTSWCESLEGQFECLLSFFLIGWAVDILLISDWLECGGCCVDYKFTSVRNREGLLGYI